MTVSLEQLTQIIATTGISSSQEEHILTTDKSLTTPPKLKEESSFEELRNIIWGEIMQEGDRGRRIRDFGWYKSEFKSRLWNFHWTMVSTKY